MLTYYPGRFRASQTEPAAEIIHHQIDIMIIVARDDRW